MHFKIDAKVGADSSGQINYIEICNTKNSNLYTYNVSVDKNVNNSDNASFTMLKQCPGYNQLYVLGTAIKISVENPQGTAWLPVFLGRVISINTDFMFQQTVNCEGALSWLGDIIVRPKLWYIGKSVWVEDATKPGGGMTVTQYVQRNVLPSEMMTYVDSSYSARRSSERKVYLSMSGVSPALTFASDGTPEYPHYMFEGVTDYKSALDWVKNFADLDNSAMYYAVPANNGWEAAVIFISSQDTYGTSGLPTISYANNLLDLQQDQDGSNMFTSVIALGKDKLRLNDWYIPDPSNPSQREQGYELDHVDNAAVGFYGNIERVENFDNKAGVELYSAASEYVNAAFWNYNATGFNVDAIDPLFQNGMMLTLGDHVKLTDIVHFGQARETMECIVTSVRIELDRPGSCSYTFFPCGTTFKKSTAKPLSMLLAENSAKVLSKAEYMKEQQAESYNVLGDNTVLANYADGRSDMYQLVDDGEGNYYYQKLVGEATEQ